MAVTPQDVDVRGIQLEAYAGGDGPPLLFLHPGEGLRPTAPYLERLALTHRVVAVSHPGFGGSEIPDWFRTIQDLAYFYLDLMDQLELDDVTLVGVDFGAWIAAEVAVRSTARVGRMLLCSPVGIKVGDRETRDLADIWAHSPAELTELLYVDTSFAASDQSNLRQEWEGLSDDELRGIVRSRESLALFAWDPYMHNPQLRNWLHRIDVPTVVAAGSEDVFTTPSYAKAFAELIPGARFELLQNVGHYPHIEALDAFDQLVQDLTAKV